MRTCKNLFFAAVVMMAASLAFMTGAWATEDVRNTKHNLITNPNIGAQGTTEVCVFCHTPHGGATDVGGTGVSAGQAPLWNRTLSSATFTAYSSPNFDAEGVTAGTPKGVSLACLSCHDGTVAFDSLLNFGGSGSTDNITGFTGSFVDTDGSFKETLRSAGGPSPFPNLGPDLRNDHPISMKIPINDPQFDEIRANLDTARLTAGKVAYLWRGTTDTTPTDPRDKIRAYPTQGDGNAYIECASCHNPHEGTSTRFLRYPSASAGEKLAANLGAPGTETDRNKGSLVCLTCHQK